MNITLKVSLSQANLIKSALEDKLEQLTKAAEQHSLGVAFIEDFDRTVEDIDDIRALLASF